MRTRASAPRPLARYAAPGGQHPDHRCQLWARALQDEREHLPTERPGGQQCADEAEDERGTGRRNTFETTERLVATRQEAFTPSLRRDRRFVELTHAYPASCPVPSHSWSANYHVARTWLCNSLH
jgi:hypothetical protein